MVLSVCVLRLACLSWDPGSCCCRTNSLKTQWLQTTILMSLSGWGWPGTGRTLEGGLTSACPRAVSEGNTDDASRKRHCKPSSLCLGRLCPIHWLEQMPRHQLRWGRGTNPGVGPGNCPHKGLHSVLCLLSLSPHLSPIVTSHTRLVDFPRVSSEFVSHVGTLALHIPVGLLRPRVWSREKGN